ncbi:MAG: hypothetical protein RJA81_247 [Planctomycetota bacterium]
MEKSRAVDANGSPKSRLTGIPLTTFKVAENFLKLKAMEVSNSLRQFQKLIGKAVEKF